MAKGRSHGAPGEHRVSPSFDDVYRKHNRRVFGICFNLLGNADDAEDATQETFVKAAPHLVNFEGNVGAYLAVVARNVCCDEVRRRVLQRKAATRFDPAGGREEIEARAVDRSTLSGLLPRLTHGERELLLRSFAGYSYDEIADRTGAPVGTIRVRLARARKRARGLAGGIAAIALLPAWRLLRRTGGARAAAASPVSSLADQVALVSAGVATSLLAAVVPLAQAGAGGAAVPSTGITAMAPAATAQATGTSGAPATGATTPAAAATAASGSVGSASAGGTAAGGASGGGRVAGPLPSLVPDGSQTGAGGTWFQGTSSAPDGAGPTYAWGGNGSTCETGCALLFRSGDGGHTWTQLPAQQLTGGPVLVSPARPSTLFAMPSSGALISSDGGTSFHPIKLLAPAGASPAVALPDDGSGHARLAVAWSHSVLVYDAQSDSITQSIGIPAELTQVDDLAVAGSTILLSGVYSPLSSTPRPVVWTCPTTPGAQCGPAGSATQHWAGAHVHLLAVAGNAGLVVAYASAASLLATGDGAHFVPLQPTGLSGAVLAAAARWLGGTVQVVVETAPSVRAVLVQGASVAPLRSLPGGEAQALMLLAGGGILAAGADVDAASVRGLRCTLDLGATWGTC